MALRDRFRGQAQTKLPLPSAPLVAILVGAPRAREREGRDTQRKKEGMGKIEHTLGALPKGLLSVF